MKTKTTALRAPIPLFLPFPPLFHLSHLSHRGQRSKTSKTKKVGDREGGHFCPSGRYVEDKHKTAQSIIGLVKLWIKAMELL